MIDNPSNLPPVTEIEMLEEPVVNATIMTPSEYVGSIMEICQERRGIFVDMNYIEETRASIHYLLPLNEIRGSRFTRSRDDDTDEFVRRLEAKGISTTIRDTRGDEIDAACGQLAALE